jgi:cytochrome c
MSRVTRLKQAMVLGALVLGSGGAPVLAGDGGSIYMASNCQTCHGENGSHPISPDYPVIAGQNARYLLRQMIDIRDGHRTNGLTATMRPAVAEVTDDEFAAIAEWLALQY